MPTEPTVPGATTTADAVIVIDERGKITEWNSHAAELFGWTPDEAVGRDLAGLIIPERFRAAHNRGFGRLLAEGGRNLPVTTMKLVGLRRDGREVPIEVTLSSAKAGATVRFTAIARDLSERRRAGHEFRESEEKFRVIFEASTDAISIQDPDMRFAEVNEEFVRVTGFSREETIGKTPAELELFCGPSDAAKIAAAMTADGAVRNLEVKFRARDGSEGWGLFSSRLIEVGGKTQILAIVRDITHLKRTERQLLESEEKFRKVFEDAVVGIAILSVPRGRFLDANEEFLKLAGYQRNELVGKTMAEVGRPEEQRLVENTIALVIASEGSIRNLEAEARGKRGIPRSILFSATAAEIRGRQRVVAFVRDITEQKRAEQALLEAGRAAMAAERAKSELLAWMSHEIRTPMNAILGVADLLSETPLSLQQRDYVRLVRSTGNTLLNLVEGILDLSRAQAGRLRLRREPFDLRELAESVAEVLTLRANRKGIRLGLEIAPDVPASLSSDSFRLRQVLINLLDNGLKFTTRGEVVLRIASKREGPASGVIHFSVTDTGAGIPPAKLETLFQNSVQIDFRNTREFGRSGLGLRIARSLVESMGGRIWAESEPGRGSTFHFTLPLVPAAEHYRPAGPDESASIALGNFGQRRILLVDDSDDNRFLVESYLRDTPCRLEIAENGEAAVRKFKDNEYDLVLMDMQMPVMDGYAAVAAIRQWEREQNRPSTPIVALTAYAFDEDLERSRAVGCNAYLTKPLRKARLLETILEFAGGRT
jgi:PAS domain S-box-containing protein